MVLAVLVAGTLIALLETAVRAAALEVGNGGVGRSGQEEGGKDLNELHVGG